MEADHDLPAWSREQLIEEVKKLRVGIRKHRDSTGQDLCWHHPALWDLLPEKTDPKIEIPDWSEFMKGCIQYRTSLDEIVHATRSSKPFMNAAMKYQNGKGATGALLAEYEKAIIALQHIIADIPDEDLISIVDPATESPECRSIQTILTHVVSSGFSYCIYIRNFKNKPDIRPQPVLHTSAAEYVQHLDKVMAFTAETFIAMEDNELERYEDNDKIHTRWGQIYDFEQMMEHAIVHILRHRRQIEGFKRKLNEEG